MTITIATTIAEQIKQIDRWALPAWGAKEMIDMGDGLKFKTSGTVGWKGYVYIKLSASDLYDIDFFKIRGTELKYAKQIKGVFVTDLVARIDQIVQ